MGQSPGSFVWIDDAVACYVCSCGAEVTIGVDYATECDCGKKYKLRQVTEAIEVTEGGEVE